MKKIIVGFVAVALLATAVPAFAQSETGADMQSIVSRLRTAHQELKAQVNAGEITREEAHSKWLQMIADARAKKDAHYADRMAKAKAKIEKIAEKNPERAAQLRERVDNIARQRASLRAERESITDGVMNGEINREEAHRLRTDIRQEQAEKKARIETQRAERQAQRDERRENHSAKPGNAAGVSAGTGAPVQTTELAQ